MSDPASPAGEISIVLSTMPTAEAAGSLVRQLLEERLIACGNVVPAVTSLYRWEGEVVAENEVLVLLKTPRENVARLFERIARIHPYEVPELVAVPVDAVSCAYGRWVRRETIEVNA